MAAEHIQAALAGLPQFLEWKGIQHDGTAFDADVHLNRLAIGEDVYVQVVVRNITERRQGEEALGLFRTLVDQSNDAIEVLDPETAGSLM